MKLNKMVVVGFIFLTFLSLSCVSAGEDNTTVIEMTTSDDAYLQSIELESGLSVGDESEDLDVKVSNVFNGFENAITVNYPNATGNVDITVGDKTYSSTFINGSATQIISDYKNGINVDKFIKEIFIIFHIINYFL